MTDVIKDAPALPKDIEDNFIITSVFLMDELVMHNSSSVLALLVLVLEINLLSFRFWQDMYKLGFLLSKCCKGLLSLPLDRRTVVFVDDLNIPAREEYGA
ncbi:dynein axonemal heavy chain 7-like [Dysidea avara]|uniref:dynein axonemal heavy chain 7-like n=1 Tax=Dysidea avara TaxID=196820 RepID=UPI003323AFD4